MEDENGGGFFTIPRGSTCCPKKIEMIVTFFQHFFYFDIF